MELKDFHTEARRTRRKTIGHLRGLYLSFDQWLLLTVEDGNDKLIHLFEAMYTGLLAPHRRHDIEYIPHIGLGYFGMEEYDLTVQSVAPLDELRYNKGLRKAESVSLPVDKFFATWRGRTFPDQKLDPSKVNSVGFLLGDKKAGPFKLEVDRIKVRSSTSRRERP